jgi:mRNA interferase MazF
MPYVPDRGDIIWISLDPQLGHEQAGRRPALILSPQTYNGRVGLAVMCPITTQAKGYPFEVAIASGGPISGVILADQVKSLDWQARNAQFITRLSETTVVEALQKLHALLRL